MTGDPPKGIFFRTQDFDNFDVQLQLTQTRVGPGQELWVPQIPFELQTPLYLSRLSVTHLLKTGQGADIRDGTVKNVGQKSRSTILGCHKYVVISTSWFPCGAFQGNLTRSNCSGALEESRPPPRTPRMGDGNYSRTPLGGRPTLWVMGSYLF